MASPHTAVEGRNVKNDTARGGNNEDMSALILHRIIMLLQGIYYVATGLWPLVHLGSFEAITGPKVDRFTLRSTALLIVIVGALLMLASRKNNPDPGFTALGAATAVGLASVEAVHVRKVRPVYRLEAIGEIMLAASLLGTRLLSGPPIR